MKDSWLFNAHVIGEGLASSGQGQDVARLTAPFVRQLVALGNAMLF